MRVLERTQFGNSILRKKARLVNPSAISSARIQNLIADMRHTLISKKLGIGLAAPQVGQDLQIAVIAIRPAKHRPKIKKFDMVLINPKITELRGNVTSKWEGCISSGSGGKADLFAKVPRHTQLTLSYLDENGMKHTEKFSGLKAQVIQHEVDHLEGKLFVDRVKDSRTFTTYSEYLKLVKKRVSKSKK